MRRALRATLSLAGAAIVVAGGAYKAMGDPGPISMPSFTPSSVEQVDDQPTAAPTPTGDYAAALATLNTLPVKGRAPKTGYSRAAFGKAWTDDVTVEGGGNGCRTREDILARDLVDVTYAPGKKKCKIQSGTLQDPYTGKTIFFQRGEKTSAAIQIDHLVPLANAYQTGAQQLSASEKANFANDPRNLLAVDGPENEKKSDGDAATWLPSNKAYRCQYVSAQIRVKSIYHLWVTPPEKSAMERVLSAC